MKTFITSDMHFHHHNILTFKDEEGKLVRPFNSIEDMHETIITNWNNTIGPDDKVYVLGDVVMRTSAWAFEILSELNGRKALIKGNHDTARINRYTKYFTDIRAYHLLKSSQGHKIYLSHVPMHPYSLGKGFNVHGHLHHKIVKYKDGDCIYNDLRYINVCVEQTNYTPVSYVDISNYVDFFYETVYERNMYGLPD